MTSGSSTLSFLKVHFPSAPLQALLRRPMQEPHSSDICSLWIHERTQQSSRRERGRHEQWAAWLAENEVFVKARPPSANVQDGLVSRVWLHVEQMCTEKVLLKLPDAHVSVATYHTPLAHDRRRLTECLEIFKPHWPRLSRARLRENRSAIEPGFPVCMYLAASENRTPIPDLLDLVDEVADLLQHNRFKRAVFPPAHISIYWTMDIYRITHGASIYLNEDHTGFQTIMDAEWLQHYQRECLAASANFQPR